MKESKQMKYIKPLNERAKHTSTDFSKPGNDGDIYFSKREGDAVGVRLGDKLQMIYVFQEEPKLGRIQKSDKRWENMGPASEELLIDLRGREEGKILFKFVSTLEESVNEGKMPKKYIGNDEIVYLKTKEDSRGAHYNLYYKGHDIDKGGRRFGSEKELEDFAANYILSNQLYKKLRYEDSIPLPESVNESLGSYEYNKWIKENGKIKYPKWVTVTRKEIIKKGLMDSVYDSESHNMSIWINSLGKNFFVINADSKKREKEFGKNGSAFINAYYNDITGYTAFAWEAATICLELIKHIEDRIANGEEYEPAYYLAKEYFNNFGMDTKRSRVFDSTVKKLSNYMADNNLDSMDYMNR
jgi:hypothetical protein